MYYLFQYLSSGNDKKFIQLTFNGQLVDTRTTWSPDISDTIAFTKANYTSETWSTKNEWLTHDDYILLTTSPTPITSLTHPELLL